MAADRGLGQRQLARGARQAALAHDREERAVELPARLAEAAIQKRITGYSHVWPIPLRRRRAPHSERMNNTASSSASRVASVARRRARSSHAAGRCARCIAIPQRGRTRVGLDGIEWVRGDAMNAGRIVRGRGRARASSSTAPTRRAIATGRGSRCRCSRAPSRPRARRARASCCPGTVYNFGPDAFPLLGEILAAAPDDAQGRDPRRDGTAPAEAARERRAGARRARRRLLRPARREQLVQPGAREARPPARASVTLSRHARRRPRVGLPARRRRDHRARCSSAPTDLQPFDVFHFGRPLVRRAASRWPRRRARVGGARRGADPPASRGSRSYLLAPFSETLPRDARDALPVAATGRSSTTQARRVPGRGAAHAARDRAGDTLGGLGIRPAGSARIGTRVPVRP